MILIPATDMLKVREFMLQDEIWDRAAEDYENKDGFFPSNNKQSVWLSCFDNNDLIGMILVHHDNSTTLRIHPYMKDKMKGRDMMSLFFEWFLSLPDQIQKVVVSIPKCYKKVYNFSKKVGFIDEGVNRLSYTKSGGLFDQWNLGLTRSEIEAL